MEEKNLAIGHDNAFEFFTPKSVCGISGEIQLLIVVFLYVITVFAQFFEYKTKGNVLGYPPGTSLIFVPIYEELIFRGVCLKYFQSRYGTLKSIGIVSILFGIWHLKNIFWISSEELFSQCVYTAFIFGPIVAWITLKTRTLWPAVILHFLNNLPYALINSMGRH